MAQRRMFALTIVDSDAFMDMPLSTQALYFHLSMRADDDGFLNSPKKIQRMIGASDDDLKLLIAKHFILPFESGVIVIKHWKMHNQIKKDRYKPTVYQEEKDMLSLKENGSYTFGIQSGDKLEPECIQIGTTGQVSLGKDSLGKLDDQINKLTNKLTDSELRMLDETYVDYQRLLRVVEFRLAQRTDSSEVSDPYKYVEACAVNEDWPRR